jgi:hypothetical protein
MAKKPDPRQPSLFDSQREAPRPGSMGFTAELRSALARAIKECPKSRAIIAAEMTDLVFGETAGDDGQITVDQLNAWTAPSRTPWRFPLEYLPAFVEVTKAFWLLDIIAERCRCRVLFGEEAKLAIVGALQHQRERLRAVEENLKSRIDPSAAERLLKRTGGGRP